MAGSGQKQKAKGLPKRTGKPSWKAKSARQRLRLEERRKKNKRKAEELRKAKAKRLQSE